MEREEELGRQPGHLLHGDDHSSEEVSPPTSTLLKHTVITEYLAAATPVLIVVVAFLPFPYPVRRRLPNTVTNM
jgi:hypothetical protein